MDYTADQHLHKMPRHCKERYPQTRKQNPYQMSPGCITKQQGTRLRVERKTVLRQSVRNQPDVAVTRHRSASIPTTAGTATHQQFGRRQTFQSPKYLFRARRPRFIMM